MAATIKGPDGSCCACEQRVEPCGECAAACPGVDSRTRGGVAGLCGWAEYTTPSTPPRIYRRIRKRRRVAAELFTSNTCTSPLIGITANASGTAPVSGVISGVSRSGTLTYSVLDEAFSQSWSGTFGSYGFVAFFRSGETEPWDGWTRANTRPVGAVGTYTMRACMTDTGDFPGPPDPGRYVLGASLGTYVIGPKSIASDTTDEQAYTPGTCVVPEDPLIPPDLDPDPESSTCAYALSSRSRVELRYDGTEDCCFNASTGNFEKHTGFLIDTLLDADTEDAAVDRLLAESSWSAWDPLAFALGACVAVWQPRTAAGQVEFAYQEAEARLRAPAGTYPPGQALTWHLQLWRAPYGSVEFVLFERVKIGINAQPDGSVSDVEYSLPNDEGWVTLAKGCGITLGLPA